MSEHLIDVAYVEFISTDAKSAIEYCIDPGT